MPATLSAWAVAMSGPISMSSPSAGSPHLMVRTWSASADTNLSYTFGPAITRVAAVQSWPGSSSRPSGGSRRELDVGVVEDDDRRLAAELEVEPLDGVRRDLRDPLAGRGITRDRHHADLRVTDQRVTDIGARAGQHVDHTGRQDPAEDLSERERAQRRPRRRLQHDRAAGRERRAELPGRHIERVVPRRDRRHDADRIPSEE